MTTGADPWVPGPGPWPEDAAVRALERVQDAVQAALRRLEPAADVDWDVGRVVGPAARYRRDLADLTGRLRAARAQAEVAVRASDRHAAAVRHVATGPTGLVAPTGLTAPASWWAPARGWGDP